jgi:hypothetical protein
MRKRSAVLAGALLLAQSSCMTWRQTAVPLAAPGEPLPEQVRLTLASSRTVMLYRPRATADSIIGMGEPPKPGRDAWRVALPLSEVVRIERGDISTIRTGATAIIITVFVLKTLGAIGDLFVPTS